jgi:hypothetical protein
MALVCLLIFSLLFATMPTAGQDVLTVPDLNGLSVPQAAAALSRAGLELGQKQIIAVDPEAGDTENTIVEQSPAAGEAVKPGTLVDIVVARVTNAYLLYDDNDLTLVNMTAGLLDLNDIVFSATEPAGAIEFSPSAWAGTISEGHCGQIWSVARLSSKPIDGCSVILWMTAANSNQHFWTYTSGVEQFAVIQEGVVRATCPAAPAGSQDAPLRCDIAFDIIYPDEHVNYIYLAYTTDRLIIHNQTADRWMEFTQTFLRDRSGHDIDLSMLNIFNTENRPARLAPGQCLLFAADADAQPLESCQVIERVEADTVFWLEPFRVIGRDDYPRVCEAAVEGTLMICVMLR